MVLSVLRNQLVIAALFCSLTAQAGEALRLRTGSFDPKTRESDFVTQSVGGVIGDYVIQFQSSPTEEVKSKLRTLGVEFFKYLPDDAFIVTLPNAGLNQIKRLAEVRSVIPFTAELKLSADFEGFSVFTAKKVEKILVVVLKSENLEKVKKQTEALKGTEVLFAEGRSMVVVAEQHALAKLAQFGGIEHIQPMVEMKTWFGFDGLTEGPLSPEEELTPAAGDYTDLSSYEDGTKVMNFEPAWNAGLTGKNMVVAMADTGLDSGDTEAIHADLKGAVKSGFIHGMFATSWNDPMGHGTHVAGSILSRGTSSSGKIKGGAYDAMMVAQGMWSPVLSNLTVPPKLEKLFSQAYGEGARIHSNSWGAAKNFGAYDSFAQQVDEFVFSNPELLPIFAAGNSGVDANKDGRIDGGSVSSPGTSKNALTVGASENYLFKGGIQAQIKQLRAAAEAWPAEPIQSDTMSNNPNGLAMFSSRGPCLDGRIKPDVVAPGTNILSLKSQVEGSEDMWGLYNSLYAYSGGTSMATPLVAGAAAVARQNLVKLGEANPSAALLKAYIIHHAVDMFPGQFGEVGEARGQELLTLRPNSDEGYGRVDVSKYVESTVRLIDEKQGVKQDEEKTVIVNANGGEKLMFTLVYSDAPAAANAAVALVNDLDLVVENPDGTETALNDRKNNIEMVEINNAKRGKYTVKVKGLKVPQGVNGSQPYALVVTGPTTRRIGRAR